MTLPDISVIIGPQKNIFSVRRAPQKGFQVTSEEKALILEKISTGTCFYEKMVNHSGKGCILNTKLYTSANDDALLAPEKRNLEGKAAVQPKVTAVNNK